MVWGNTCGGHCSGAAIGGVPVRIERRLRERLKAGPPASIGTLAGELSASPSVVGRTLQRWRAEGKAETVVGEAQVKWMWCGAKIP